MPSSAPLSSRPTSTSLEHLRLLSLAVQQCKKVQSQQGNAAVEKSKDFAKLETLLKAASENSNPVAFETNPEVISDLHWPLTLTSSRPPLTWRTLNLVTRLASRSEKLRKLMRDKLRSVAVLTDLLLALPDTSKEKFLKVLEALTHVTFGIKLHRVEDFLLQLVPRLLMLIDSKEENERSLTLFILASLVRNNQVAARFLLSLMDGQMRKSLFVQECDSDKVKVIIHHLNHSLAKTSLSGNLVVSKWDHGKLETRLSQIRDAFCSAYGEDDCLQMDFLTCFVKDLSNDGGGELVKVENMVSLIQQVLLVADYSDGSDPLPDEAMFRFFSQLIPLCTDSLGLVDLLARATMPRLEGSHGSEAIEAVTLVRNVLHKVRQCQMPDEDTRLQNLKLQLETTVARLCDLVLLLLDTPSAALSHKALMTHSLILESLSITCSIQPDWADMVGQWIKPGHFHDSVQELKGADVLLPGVILLIRSLAETNSAKDHEWKKLVGVIYDDAVKDRLVLRLRMKECGRRERESILAVLSSSSCVVFQAEMTEEDDLDLEEEPFNFSGEDEVNQEILEKLAKDLESDCNVEDIHSVLQLGDWRLSAKSRQIGHLKSSLKLADQRIVQQNEELALLERELQQIGGHLHSALLKSQAAEQEAAYIRKQHFELEEETTRFRKQMNKEADLLERDKESLTKEIHKLAAKTGKYKEKVDSLQEAVQEHVRVNEEFQSKLKAESRINSELAAALEKREEKLKKKERQLEEESNLREKLEGELDSAKKEAAMLQSLSKRQEQALAKKEKQLQEQSEELAECRKIQEQILNLAKFRST